MTGIDPEILSAARTAISDELAWAAQDKVDPWQSAEALHSHRLAAALEHEGWHGYLEAYFDQKTLKRGTGAMGWHRADLYAAHAEERMRMWVEVKRLWLSPDGRSAGNARYPTSALVSDWARDLERLAQGPAEQPGWTTWRIFYLVVRWLEDADRYEKLGCGAGDPSLLPASDACGAVLSDAIGSLDPEGDALDLLDRLLKSARRHGLAVAPVLEKAVRPAGTTDPFWFPLLIGWTDAWRAR